MDTITMEFTIDEMNQILAALSKEPFKDVYTLIGKINDVANDQLNKNKDSSEAKNP